jgi:hypothetical protein
MSRTERRRGKKSYKRIVIRSGESRHHRRCRSLGGTDDFDNISVVTKTLHDHWHAMWSNLTPPLIARIISEKWIDRRYRFACIDVRTGKEVTV